jgi:hypothetical protein
LPSASSRPGSPADRYKGKPLLIVVENYILDTIGALPADKREKASRIVQDFFANGVACDWRQTLRATLRIHDSIDDVIRTSWAEVSSFRRGPHRKNSPPHLPIGTSSPAMRSATAATATATRPRASRPMGEQHRSVTLLRAQSVPVLESLPTIETSTSIRIRAPREVATRATVLSILAARAEPGGFSARPGGYPPPRARRPR